MECGAMENEKDTGWIALHRKIFEWEWYSDINTTRLFIHMLLRANHKSKKWQGIDIPRGSFISGRKKLAQETGLSEQQIRTSLKKLKMSREVTSKSTRKNTLFLMVNYSLYQDQQPQKTPEDNHVITTNNNVNNDNNIKEKNIKKRKNKFKRPKNVNKQIWDDFCEMRKVKKAPITKTVMTKIENEALKINWDLQKAIEHMLLRNWQGFNHKWILNEQQRDNGNGKQSKLDQAKQSAIDWVDGR